jgi:hypothetical protein
VVVVVVVYTSVAAVVLEADTLAAAEASVVAEAWHT